MVGVLGGQINNHQVHLPSRDVDAHQANAHGPPLHLNTLRDYLRELFPPAVMELIRGMEDECAKYVNTEQDLQDEAKSREDVTEGQSRESTEDESKSEFAAHAADAAGAVIGVGSATGLALSVYVKMFSSPATAGLTV